jgi:prepilin-type N-terminal cleavage/methylation domain-containing protein/prepilin-type processing-associated H-X9-DG protein
MRRGFTLVEILVSIGIVTLLAAIAIPSLRVARARADSAKCVSHLRSLGVALNLYLADHQMIMPDIEAGRASKTEDVPVIDNTIDSYVDNQGIFTCPAGRHVAEKSGTSYYWNSALRGQAVAALRLFWLDDPGKIPVLVDKEGWHRYVEDKVNHLFADGHVTNELRLIVEEGQ